jgi:GxxExxY protein
MMDMNLRELPHVVVGSLMEVHKELGPGLIREAYVCCLAHEFRMREILFNQDVPISVAYKGLKVATGFTLDFLVEGVMALHVYALDTLENEHKERLRNHLQLSELEMGFIVNFDCVDLRKGGLKRLIVSANEPDMPWRRVDDDNEVNVRRIHEM